MWGGATVQEVFVIPAWKVVPKVHGDAGGGGGLCFGRIKGGIRVKEKEPWWWWWVRMERIGV